MKIAMVCASDAHGGLEKHVIDLASGMASRGHEVSIIAPFGLESRLPASVDFRPVNFNKPRWSPWLRKELCAALEGSWDIVHAHANKATHAIQRIKHHVRCPRWLATVHNLKSNNSMYAGFDEVIAVSELLRTNIPNQKVTVILNGILPMRIDTHCDRQWLAEQTGLDVSKPILLAIGRLVAAKGFDWLISASAKSKTQVVIVGDGSEAGALNAQRVRLKADNVVLLGHRDDIPALLNACDGVVISSRNEGGPYVLAEALLANKPVLSTDVGMVPDVLPSELILPKDENAIAKALLTWVDDLKGWEQACKPAFNVAKGRLTLDSMLSLTEMVYRNE